MDKSSDTAQELSLAANRAAEADFLEAEQLRRLQDQRLRHVVRRAYDRVAIFRNRMQASGVDPEQIKGVDDLKKLPLTAKNDLRDAYPYGLLASPMADIVRLHSSSGTTGKPIVVAYTQRDVDVWTEVMLRTLNAYGIHSRDIVQNAFGYGLFTGGLGMHYGSEKLGATVVPISGGNTDRQIALLRDFEISVIACTPSYFLHVIDRALELGVNLRDLPLRIGVFGAEPWTEAMRQHIEKATGIQAFDIYGLSEIVGPGVAAECQLRIGLHIFEDHFLPEIIDPETTDPVPDGVEGELVLTTLSKEAMPLIRYRTGDITSLVPDPCPCGRVLRRIRRIGRRSDDMIIIRGVNVYPSQIEAALLEVEGTLPHYQIVLSREKHLDQLEIQVEGDCGNSSGSADLATLQETAARQVKRLLGIRATVSIVPPQTIPRSEGKAKRVIDRRNL